MWRRDRERRAAPSWGPTRGKTRVLVEARDGADGWACEQILERRGYEVAICPGPESGRIPCPVLEGNDCPAARGADLIVSLLNLSHAPSRTVVRALGAMRPAKPIVIEVSDEDRIRNTDLVARTTALDAPVLGTQLSRAVDEALAAR